MAEIRPQAAQAKFLSSPADIAIYGGAAGGGKSWALLLEATRHVASNAQFTAVVFRRNLTDVHKPGGLWDTSVTLYGGIGARPRTHKHDWVFPGGGSVVFGHLEHENSVLEWQGAQIPLICFDELTHFSRSQFFYMMSRNRSTCGVRPYIRATTNPDADSWVAEFISWWIDQDTGLPIPERGGMLRWFVRVNDALVWADTEAELLAKHPHLMPKSVTFIPSKLSDNQALMQADPGYLGNLLALAMVERARLLDGNWKIRPSAGLYFQRKWLTPVDALPAGLTFKRGWDLAGTEKTTSNDPDFTSGILLGRDDAGRLYIADRISMRASPSKVEATIVKTAAADGTNVEIGLPQDPGQAGKAQGEYLVRQLSGYTVRVTPESGDKLTRFSPFSSQCEAGNVYYLRAAWNTELFDALEALGGKGKDDDADAISRAFRMFNNANDGLLEFYRRQAQEMAEKSKPASPKQIELIVLQAPHGISSAFGLTGRQYNAGPDGVMHVHPDDVGPLQRAGFTKID